MQDESENNSKPEESSPEPVRPLRGAFPSPPEVQNRVPQYVPPEDSDAGDMQVTKK